MLTQSMPVAESLIRLVTLSSSCLRLVEEELGRAGAGEDQPGIEAALDRVQRLRPAVELIEQLIRRTCDEEGKGDGQGH